MELAISIKVYGTFHAKSVYKNYFIAILQGFYEKYIFMYLLV